MGKRVGNNSVDRLKETKTKNCVTGDIRRKDIRERKNKDNLTSMTVVFQETMKMEMWSGRC